MRKSLRLLAYSLGFVFLETGLLAQTIPVVQLEKVDSAKILKLTNANKPHILFVNVSNAVENSQFCEAVASVSLVLPVRLCVQNINALNVLQDVVLTNKVANISSNSKIIVYVIRDPQFVNFICVPRKCAVINISSFERDRSSMSHDQYQSRLRKLMQKGFGLACGIGGTPERGRCVMSFDSFSPETIDSTILGFSPYARFPIQDVLEEIAGDDIYLSE